MVTKKQSSHKQFAILTAVIIGLTALVIYLASRYSFPIFQTEGRIADEQKRLILVTLALSLVVVIPVFVMMFVFAIKYRDGHHNEYKPDWDHNNVAEAVWWGVPMILIIVLAAITWQSSHALDPFKPVTSSQKPLEVQVVALEWKWLFIYPEQKVASLNELRIPAGRPVHFTITSDAPMNSFWIPALGGQIYAMSGMNTELSLEAHKPGTYRGSSANLSGDGFADMNFETKSMPPALFSEWIGQGQRSNNAMNSDTYNELAKPSKQPPVLYYSLKEQNLYDKVMVKYKVPGHEQLSADDDPAALLSSVGGH